MAWYTFWRKRRQRTDPAKQAKGKQRDGDARKRYLDYLEEHNFDKWLRIMERESGLGIPDDDALTQWLTLQERFKKSGLLPDSSGRDSVEKFIDHIPELVDKLGPLIVQMALARQGIIPRQPEPRALPEPAEERATNPAPKSRARHQEVAPVGIPVKAKIAAAIALLDHLEPPDAAKWLLGQAKGNDALNGVLDLIRTTPDDQLLATLDRHIATEPDFIELGTFLARKGEWTFECARSLRRLAIRRVSSSQPRKVATL